MSGDFSSNSDRLSQLAKESGLKQLLKAAASSGDTIAARDQSELDVVKGLSDDLYGGEVKVTLGVGGADLE